ncbi:MAG: 1-(5-phosphoribosyl)-5-[(5-phosphoribosylamino)methylideneamino] imidazole-4-carboxamide isomerase [Chlorobiaceae bacterium]|nr:1-(5-phosphoribosyl)-5-[(5-phosphoribosylamino)methylideneamino] imidazole-4-carboxamide isomerase [Chlorobiaceae bacterium]MBA4308793.1 1-(5-phosphoribosyl)-5-[(5-phosphoribosylamino)methylideneamino] imidazole-4-carboxamide isomerase [Chlorobiaceae bacterium]
MPFILVIPSIDIKDRKTVRVVQGIPEIKSEEYGNDPVEMAKIWRAENAKTIHIVDFNAIEDHSDCNFDIIAEICRSVVIPVELAGGIRSLSDAEKMFDLGVARIVISTLCFENPAEFKKVIERFGPSKVAAAIDFIDDEVVIRGRKIKTGLKPVDESIRLSAVGVERFIVTDVKRNGMLLGPNIEMCKTIANVTKARVTISGGVRNKDELMDIQTFLPIGIDSVIIGRALYENRFPCQKLWRIAEIGLFS